MSETPKNEAPKPVIDSPHEPLRSRLGGRFARWQAKRTIEKNGNQIDSIEQRVTPLKIQIQAITETISELESLKQSFEHEATAEDSDGGSTITPIEQAGILRIESRVNTIKKTRDTLRTQLESLTNEKISALNTRDKSIDQLIDYHTGRLTPLMESLQPLQEQYLTLDLQFDVAEVKYKSAVRKMEDVRRKTNEVNARMSSLGVPMPNDDTIITTLMEISQNLNEDRRTLLVRMKNVQDAMVPIKASVEAIKDERDALIRVKKTRPINDVPSRERLGERNTSWQESAAFSDESAQESVAEEVSLVSEYLQNLNHALGHEDAPSEHKKYIINPISFTSFTGLAEEDSMTIDDFVNFLKKYYIAGKIADKETIESDINTIYGIGSNN